MGRNKSVWIQFFFLFATCFSVEAQTLFNNLNPKPYFQGLPNYSSYFFNDEKTGWIVSGMGKLSKTEDGGKSWTQKSITDSESGFLHDITFSENEQLGWICGASGSIYLSNNYGKSWNKIQDVPTSENLLSIYFSKNLKFGISVGENGAILISTDQGKTWTQNSASGSDVELNDALISEDGTILIAAGEEMTLLVSKNSGKNWIDKFPNEESYKYKTPIIYSLATSRNNEVITAACEYGNILSSLDRGENWKVTKINKVEYLKSIDFDSSMKNGWTISSEGQIFKTADGGTTWKQVYQVEDSTNLYSIKFNSIGKTGLICGTNGLTMMTKDGGNSWTHRATPTFDIREFTLNEKGELTFASNKGIITHTLFKNHFVNLTQNSFKLYFNGIYDQKGIIWAAGEKNSIIANDPGTSQFKLRFHQNDSGHLNSITFSDYKNHFGVAVGSLSKIMVTEDAGKTWINKGPTDKKFTFSDVFISNNGKIAIAVGGKGSVFRSSDFGKSWNKQFFEDSSAFLQNIAFNEKKGVGFVASKSPTSLGKHLYKTKDNGTSWTEVKNFPDNNGLLHVSVNQNNDEIIITTSSGNIYRSIDFGKVWFLVSPRVTYQALSYVKFDKNSNAIIAGDFGTILISSNKNHNLSIQEIKVKDSLNYLVPHLTLHKKQNNLNNFKVKFSIISGNLIEGVDEKFEQLETKYNSKSQSWPKNIFRNDQKYTIRFSVSDGWNIVSKDTSIYIREPFISAFFTYMNWDQLPKDTESALHAAKVNLALLGTLYIIFVLTIFIFLPAEFIKWHEAVNNSRLPFPEKLSRYLVLFLIESDRILNSFVNLNKSRSLQLFNSHTDVSSRPFWVPAPFTFDNHSIVGFQNLEEKNLYFPGLSEVKNFIRNGRIIISIEGQGGVGKSSFAFQFARWGVESDSRRRLLKHQMLPIFVNSLNKPLDEIIAEKLAYITDASKISPTLVAALLRKKRILVIVDGVSEFTNFNQEFINPDYGAKDCFFVIYTSRKPINLPELSLVVPLGLKIEFLDNLLDGFTNSYVGAYKFGEHREILRTRVKEMILELNSMDSDKMVPLSILRIMVEKAAQLLESEGDINNLPNSINTLLNSYVSDIFRKSEDINSIISNLRKAASISVGILNIIETEKPIDLEEAITSSYRPQWISESIYLRHLDKISINSFIVSGIMISNGSIGDLQLKFTHDPVAEFLVAKELVIQFRDKNIKKSTFTLLADRIRETNPSLNSILEVLLKDMNLVI